MSRDRKPRFAVNLPGPEHPPPTSARPRASIPRRRFSMPIADPPLAAPAHPPTRTFSIALSQSNDMAGSGSSNPIPPRPRTTRVLPTRDQPPRHPCFPPSVQTSATNPQLNPLVAAYPNVVARDTADVEDDALVVPMQYGSQEIYWELCQYRDGLIRLDPNTWAIQDWDERTTSLKVSRIPLICYLHFAHDVLQTAKYFHLRMLPTDQDTKVFGCDCPHESCEHTRLVHAHMPHVLAMSCPPTLHPLAVLLATTLSHERYVFSVSSTSLAVHGGGKRIVVFLLSDRSWKCSSDGRSQQCHHVGYAKTYALNAGIIDETGAFIDTELLPAHSEHQVPSSVPSIVRQPISCRPIPVPRWCRIPRDTLEYDTVPNPDAHPDVIELDDTARCCCGDRLHNRAELPSSLEPFTIFGLRKAAKVLIRLSKCQQCKHWRRNYGPDGGVFGVFNWNNVYGFTHELLNQYTNVFTSAENPLSSFVTTVRRNYESTYSPVEFCSTETFTKVWFGFTSLQELDSGMDCAVCGKFPEIVVADGVSIGYSSSKYKSSLRPPSTVDSSSPINSDAKLVGAKGAALIKPALRKELRLLVDPARLALPEPYFVSPELCETVPGLAQLLPYYLYATDEFTRLTLRELFKLVRSLFCNVNNKLNHLIHALCRLLQMI